MVNTFLLSNDFEFSASLLDDKRLGKQRVEAKQIINLINYHYSIRNLTRLLSLEYPQFTNFLNPGSLNELLDMNIQLYKSGMLPTLYRFYKGKDVYIIHENNDDIHSNKLLYYLPPVDPLFTGDFQEQYLLQFVDYLDNLSPSYLNNFNEIKLGFSKHPCVKMWYFSIKMLQFYCDCHIKEFSRRGFNNQMELYESFLDNCHLPCWFNDQSVYESYLSILIGKDRQFYSPYINLLGYQKPQNHGWYEDSM